MDNWYKELKQKLEEINKQEQSKMDKNTLKLINECNNMLNQSQKTLNNVKSMLLNTNNHLNKQEKNNIQIEHIKKNNLPKPRYKYQGDEIIDTDYTESENLEKTETP